MYLLSIPSPLATLVLLTAAATGSRAAVVAWWTDLGPQVILHNDTTGLVQYSACNSRDGAEYSGTNESTFSFERKPKTGTPLGGAGYWDEELTATVASLYYLDEHNEIVNALFNCNMTTGLFESAGSWIISSMTPLPLSANSGLTTILLGDLEGFRVYYHDENMAVNELGYTQRERWTYKGVISQDRQGSSAIAAAFTVNGNISVVTPKDAENMEVTRYHDDTTWHVTTLPHPLQGDLITMETPTDKIKINSSTPTNFTLPSWNGKPGALGVSIDKAFTRSVWYIGEDRYLHCVANQHWLWGLRDSQPPEIWPVADSPNAPLAVVNGTDGRLRIYYVVNGQVAELKNDNGEWKKWSTLPQTTNHSNGQRLSTGAKIGLGVGIPLAMLLVTTALFVLLRRKRSNSLAGAAIEIGSSEVQKSIGSSNSSPSTPGTALYDQYAWDMKNDRGLIHPPDTTGTFQLDAESPPAELDSTQPRYELSDEPAAHELVGEGLVYIRRPSTDTEMESYFLELLFGELDAWR